MKRILCLTDGLSLGGAERQLIGLSYFLKRNGYNVELCSYLKRSFYEELIESYAIPATCLDVHGGRFSKIKAIQNYIKTRHFDWVIAYKDGAAISACILKMLGMKYKLIVSERNTNCTTCWRDNLKFWLFSFSDYIVPNSHSQEQFIIKNYPKLKDKVVTITNFTDVDYFIPSKKELASNGVIKIMVAARIAEQKNIIRFLEVMSKLKNDNLPFFVTWYGNASHGEEDYEDSCKRMIKDLGIEDVFEFKPATKNILEKYQSCDAFCLPSLYEGYPNAICEAMSCGKPILCSRVCDNPRIVDEGLNGMMFNPAYVDDIYDIMKRFILLSDIERKEMGINSRLLAEKRFSEDVFVNKYIKLIGS